MICITSFDFIMLSFIHAGLVNCLVTTITVLSRISAVSGICGGNFSSDEGTFSSPNFPGNYNRNEMCIYRISVPEGNKILLTFEQFQLGGRHDCKLDHIIIIDGHSRYFCGNSIAPQPYLSSGNELQIVFNSDGTAEYQGFAGKFQKVTCGGTFVSDRGRISSPNFPLDYMPNERCIYFITVPVGYVVVLIFEELKLETGSCIHDYVKIYDGNDTSIRNPNLGTFCGFMIPAPIVSSANKVIIHFGSDYTNQFSGFSLKFQTAKCGGRFVSEEGIISSPDFPDNYSPNQRCIYVITVPNNKVVHITFDVLELETHDYCSYDYIKIYDGISSIPSLGTFCGFANPGLIISSTNEVTIDFHADDTKQYKGFSATFKSEIPCRNDLCENGGICIQDDRPEVFRCACQHGYQGLRCEERILCDSSPCENGGTCIQVSVNAIFRCMCRHGYRGLKCQEKILCTNDTCENGGTCTQSGMDGTYKCTCQHGYGGEICEDKISCAEYPCKNSGDCTQDGPNGVFRCLCPQEYQGPTCKEKILCDENTCEKGGTCPKDGVNGTYKCICQHGYKGIKCGEKILCDSTSCENGGTCTQDGLHGTYRCSCRHGYKGLKCEEKIFCSEDTCENRGSCEQNGPNGVFECLCQQGYQGPTCKEMSSFLPNYLLLTGIGGILIGTIACILAIMSIIAVTRKRRKPVIPRNMMPKGIAVGPHIYENENENTYELI